jgi:hypothetical protein
MKAYATPFDRLKLPTAVLVLAIVATPGCQSIGPSTVSRDRADYSTSITESWKRQTLSLGGWRSCYAASSSPVQLA